MSIVCAERLTARPGACYPTVMLRFLAGAALALALASAPASGEPRRWAPVPEQSQVTFDARFPLGDFTGRAQDLSGEVHADTADLRGGVTGTLAVRAAALKTGLSGRDRDMHRVLDVERHPEIRFTLTGLESSFPTITERSDVLLTIRGVMFIRGVERALTIPGRVRLREQRLWVRGEATIRMTDFAITPPRRLFLAVRDELLLSFDLVLTPAE